MTKEYAEKAKPCITGLIVKATGGFYYVEHQHTIYECRARGLFRKEGIHPLVGDRVEIEHTVGDEGYVTAILPRKNVLVRPPLANIDIFVMVASISDPAPNLQVIDKMMAIACHKDIRPMLVVTKSDLGAPEELLAIYKGAGIETHCVSIENDQDLESIRRALAYGISAFTGNSGVGKSSLLNRLDPRFSIETGETSRKLGRGRHTTRHVELYQISEDGYIADTPGFSAMDLERYEHIRKEELEDCFPEFAQYLGKCRFTGCSHTVEKGCAVLEALRAGQIALSRHESYCTMYEDAKQTKDWEIKKI